MQFQPAVSTRPTALATVVGVRPRGRQHPARHWLVVLRPAVLHHLPVLAGLSDGERDENLHPLPVVVPA